MPATNRKQLGIRFPCSWGGARQGAGRKPAGARAGVAHRRRIEPSNATRGAVHVTMRVVDDVASLRSARCMRALWRAFSGGKGRFGFRLCHYAVQHNHMHLICEVDDRAALIRGMRGLSIRVARQLNKALGRSGRVLADRYHARALCSFRQLRAALAYVLNNQRRHVYQHGGWTLRPSYIDPCSSGWYFDGYAGPRDPLPGALRGIAPPVARAEGYALSLGWKRLGLVRVDEIPAAATSRRAERSRTTRR
jgi:REP-associated tyrosine transposase